ncbi:DUF4149 domain-containing protein [Rhodohalobacter sp. SW132]|uniref:DUF4149 domain-containing protein n=1 Tax=Rhodohalobacter sp. SW132 TaxID=2293433 RepID=UPI00131425D1|nr:DUF4149 domain-containing protein [Rhodohalobacter sp. SW132]
MKLKEIIHQHKSISVYTWSVFIHLIFVTFWIGGMLFTAAVLVPATRKKLSSQRGLLFTELGTRFSRLSWLIFPLLILTGFTALIGRGFTVETIFSIDFWQTTYGSRLAGKLHLFGWVLALSGIHDFWLGPKAAQLMDQEPDSARTQRFRKVTSWAGRINLLLGLGILYYAVTLVRG